MRKEQQILFAPTIALWISEQPELTSSARLFCCVEVSIVMVCIGWGAKHSLMCTTLDFAVKDLTTTKNKIQIDTTNERHTQVVRTDHGSTWRGPTRHCFRFVASRRRSFQPCVGASMRHLRGCSSCAHTQATKRIEKAHNALFEERNCIAATTNALQAI